VILIPEPPTSVGSAHEIYTPVPAITKVGLAGAPGRVAAKILPSGE
jgi:hypothetical protein